LKVTMAVIHLFPFRTEKLPASADLQGLPVGE